MKKHPSQGTDITKKDKEKPPEGFTDINLKSKSELADIQADLPVVYEDAMCNPAYETTEIEDEPEDDKTDYIKANGKV